MITKLNLKELSTGELVTVYQGPDDSTGGVGRVVDVDLSKKRVKVEFSPVEKSEWFNESGRSIRKLYGSHFLVKALR